VDLNTTSHSSGIGVNRTGPRGNCTTSARRRSPWPCRTDASDSAYAPQRQYGESPLPDHRRAFESAHDWGN